MRLVIALLGLLFALPAWAAGPSRPLPVMTTIPDLADFARQVGGERVDVKSLLKGTEDIHTYEPKVSDVKALAGARVLFTVGLGLEEWLHGLVKNAANRDLVVVETSKGAALIRQSRDREEAHHHGEANPHVWLDPANAAVMCRAIAQALETADPQGKAYYEKNLAAYLKSLDEAAVRLRNEVARLKDRRIFTYHPAWPYLAQGFGFQIAGVVTESPGQEPSAKALAALVQRIRSEKIRVLVTEPQLPSKLPNLLSHETGIRVVTLSDMMGYGGTRTYHEHMEANVRAIVSALKEAGP